MTRMEVDYEIVFFFLNKVNGLFMINESSIFESYW